MTKHAPIGILAIFASVLTTFPACAEAQVQYSVFEFPPAPNGQFVPVGINNSGVVVGNVNTHAPHGFWPMATLWDAANGYRLLPSLVGGGYIREAHSINNSGQVAGRSSLSGGIYHACRWEPDGTPTDLGVLFGTSGEGYGINDQGDVTGTTYTSQNTDRVSAFLYNNSGMHNLGDGGFEAHGRAVNSAGTVVGYRLNPPDQAVDYRAFVCDSAEGMRDLPFDPALRTYANDINNSGQIVGLAQNTPYVCDPVFGLIYPFPGGYGEAMAINDSGEVVGVSGPNSSDPFLWDMQRGLRNLNSMIASPIHGDRVIALDISDAGQILVGAVNWVSNPAPSRYYLLTPVPAPAAFSFLFAIAAMHGRPRRSG
jgi:probable HAF family extracellular repeat protein